MQVILPMSGRGARFARAGYPEIKPLIPVDGRPMIEHVVSMFLPQTEFIFICAEDHLNQTALGRTLHRIAPQGRIVPIPPHKLGPVHSVVEALPYIRANLPTLISYCDYFSPFDFEALQRYVRETGCAGCIPSYRGFHPHSLGPNLYAYLRTDQDRVLEVREKGCFTERRMEEFASAGLYYFSRGSWVHEYFPRAIREGLEINGEYYASLPYNPMIADGLDVRVFELPRFLQWGTPEDLEEYVGWSEYFASPPETPPTRTFPGTLLIPMAGTGSRFRAQGYTSEKPLIPVAGRPMLERSWESLPRMEQTCTITRRGLDTKLGSLTDHAVSICLTETSEGGMCTALAARSAVDPDGPLLIAACDAALPHRGEAFAALTDKDSGFDALVWTFEKHPHATRYPEQYSWVAADENGAIHELRYKAPISVVEHRVQGMVGAFWFRRARDFFDAAEAVLARRSRVGGEYHTELAVGELLRRGRSVGSFLCDRFLCFGTPEDVKTYEYWSSYFAESTDRLRRVG